MATPLGTSKQGRKKEALRIDAALLAGQVTVMNGSKEFTVEVARETGEVDTLTVSLPKGSVPIPHGLTATKTVVNVREIVRLALIDAGLSDTVRLRREPFRFAPINGEAGYVPTASEKRKGYKESTTESPVGDAWFLTTKESKEESK